MLYYTYLASPLGRLLLVSNSDALTGLYMEDHARGRQPSEGWAEDPQAGALPLAATQLEEYFHGKRRHFDLPLDPEGSPFQHTVWNALREIPYGETITYGELAKRTGVAGAARAVGSANARNPISIVVPCHRVVGASGMLTGYAGGLGRKEILLALEKSEATESGTGPPFVCRGMMRERIRSGSDTQSGLVITL